MISLGGAPHGNAAEGNAISLETLLHADHEVASGCRPPLSGSSIIYIRVLGIELVEDVVCLEIYLCSVGNLIVHCKINDPIVIRGEERSLCRCRWTSRTSNDPARKQRRIECTVAVVDTDVPLILGQVAVYIELTLLRRTDMRPCIAEARAQM